MMPVILGDCGEPKKVGVKDDNKGIRLRRRCVRKKGKCLCGTRKESVPETCSTGEWVSWKWEQKP